MSHKGVFSVVEIGSYKITCAICSISTTGISVLGYGCEVARGIKNGVISDMQNAASSIVGAVEKAESSFGKVVEEIYAVICGSIIQSEVVNQELNVGGHDITERDLKNLMAKASDYLSADDDRVMIHAISHGYSMDGLYVESPVGMCANKLAASINFISGARIALLNLNQVFARCRLNIKQYLIAPYMDSFACLTEDDKNIGASVINFGADNTSIISFKHSNITACKVLPFGGASITEDLAYAFGCNLIDAEKIKISHGGLSGEDETFVLSIDDEEILIKYTDLISVIAARQEEIFEQILKVENISERKIIITGGASKMQGLAMSLGNFINCKVIKYAHHIMPLEFNNAFVEFGKNDQSFTSIFGAIRYIQQIIVHQAHLNFRKKRTEKKFWNKIIEFLKNLK